MNNIIDIIDKYPDVSLNIRGAELKEAIEFILDKVANKTKTEQEVLMPAEEVIAKFQISAPTLWRWGKKGYLIPIKVGGKNFYKKNDITEMINQRE